MLLIGSRALAFRAPFLLRRDPRDFDFIGNREEILSWLSDQDIQPTKDADNKIIAEGEPPCEFEVVVPGGSSEMLVGLVNDDPTTIKTEFGLVPNLNLLFTLKASHRYLKNSPHFWKTASDYHKMKRLGCKVLPEYTEFFKLREKETYTYAHPKLNVNKDSFFSGDQIQYVYDHDSIHQAMKHLVEPAYSYFQKEGAEVACDKAKFFLLPEEVKLYSVLEETYVLALERSQIPHEGKLTPRQSFMLALSKVCSSITSGWWREFAYENIFSVIKMYDDQYLEKFKRGISTGIVKKL